MTGKKEIMDFINRILPDDFTCERVSMNFSDDYNAYILLSNDCGEDDEDGGGDE